jgi:hypothetical protein
MLCWRGLYQVLGLFVTTQDGWLPEVYPRFDMVEVQLECEMYSGVGEEHVAVHWHSRVAECI